ncbi:MAG: AAA family ATPase [Planctomycetes bacterium]|nr:AAA family ATPase [Planctomycetota bacterium]
MLRIGLSGTNWTGKTETIRRFLKVHSKLNIETISLSPLVNQCPFSMRETQTLEGSQWMVEQVKIILDNSNGEVQLFDRTPLDILAFTLYAENRTNQKNSTLIDDILGLFKYFDIIFHLQPSDKWPVNVHTEQDEIRFALQIDDYMREAIDRFAIEVVSLPWELTERQQLLSEYLLRSPNI